MDLAVGAIVEGKVTGITKFGAFVALPEGKSGMVHISEVAASFVSDIKDFLQEGQQVKVKDVIGKADKVPCEISLENHIHFGLKQAGKWVDPVETMGLK